MNPSGGSRPYTSKTTNEPEVTPRSVAAVSASALPGADVDGKLVRRMKAGDEQALGEFYDRWFPVVNSLVARMLKTPTDTEDVVEEVFWQVWRQVERFEPDRGSVSTWLLTIARSRALDRLRATRRRREDSIDESPTVETSELAQSPADPFLDAEHAERKRLVSVALAELPHEQREALELGYFGGLSQTEIAERTGLPLGTIKTRMRLAMVKLRDRLSLLREESR